MGRPRIRRAPRLPLKATTSPKLLLPANELHGRSAIWLTARFKKAPPSATLCRRRAGFEKGQVRGIAGWHSAARTDCILNYDKRAEGCGET